MNIVVNGESTEVPEQITVAALLALREPASIAAVAVNEEFVPRHQRAACKLKAGDRVEIVGPMQGG